MKSYMYYVFGTRFKTSVDFIQLLEVIAVLGFTLRHCHKLFVEEYLNDSLNMDNPYFEQMISQIYPAELE